jgi:hypothetical protein
MPAPQAEALSTSAKQTFAGKNIALPMRWKSMGPHYPDAFGAPELSTPANAPDNLFHEPTLNKYHTQAARILGRRYAHYIDGICAAICTAIDTWMHSASIVSVSLAGTIGTVLPEATIGPQLEPLIMPTAPQATRQEQKYSLAIAGALSDNWQQWQSGLSGILTYPPFGPPGPNIPAPLISFSSAGEASLAPEHLTAEMVRRLDDPGALHAGDLFASIAQAFFIHFQIFKTNCLITGVIMTPPVPPPPAPPIEEVLEPEESEAEDLHAQAADAETQAETAPKPEPEPKPEPVPGGVVIPTLGNFM